MIENINNNTTDKQDQNIITKKKRVFNKKYKYQKERKEILNKLISIVGTTFFSHEIDMDIEKQNKILEMDEDIKKYFNVSNWCAYKIGKNLKKENRPISIVKSILKDMNIEYTSKTYLLKQQQPICTTEYNVKLI